MRKHFGLLAALLLLLALCACTKTEEKEKEKEPDPMGTAKEYVSEWQQQNFSDMYARLTPKAKAGMTEEQFTQRYQKIYDGIDAKQITVTIKPQPEPQQPQETQSPNPEPSELTFAYHVRMDTIAGPIEFDQQAKLVKIEVGAEPKETKWFIDWNPSLIFPNMKEGDKVRVRTLVAERGIILDRNGNGLAINGSAPQLGIIPGKLGDDPEAVKAQLAAKLNIDVNDINKKLSASWVKPDLFVPIAIINEDEIEDYDSFPGVAIQEKKLREYPYGEAAAHLTGYIGEINAEELEKRKEKGYKVGDLLGKAGLEQVLEDQLRGTNGTVISITDDKGEVKEVLAENKAVPGTTFKLTVDAVLQQTIYEEVKQDAGSVAAIHPLTGEILALLSSPSYDPNAFETGLSGARYDEWNSDPRHPFLNRFSKGYAPGSSFKVVTAAIGLDTQTLDPNEAKPISGLTWTKDGSWGNYYVKRVHDVNPVNLTNALIYSDNIYFAQAALRVGAKAFVQEAAKFGIGEQLPIAYPISKSQLSSSDFKNDIQLADSGYGQGQVAMSSLHVALVFSALVNGGNIAYPKLMVEEDNSLPLLWKEGAMSPETADILKEDLIQAVKSPKGVGHGAYVNGATIAGKTGTAELKQIKGGDGQENGWFVGFNADDPQLLLAVMIEEVKGRGGSGYVTPKVKRIFQQVLRK
ncbi:penicillin-binding transpeptidase domain-containing protein [Cohnella endophytica]|uniref:Penicillin-binding transpeptidase domain-containing protein n=1 Tax=Cohnella endophytica TaxID=2419778 RepID=A0A494Y906_9BACL|nr:penicillin-binding transpeptidase domain-containing protein [Cohnella endophytica]RKP58098.1 penicillin-binding transpeptidase domain-containing protein [Cohnella endophytica]